MPAFSRRTTDGAVLGTFEKLHSNVSVQKSQVVETIHRPLCCQAELFSLHITAQMPLMLWGDAMFFGKKKIVYSIVVIPC